MKRIDFIGVPGVGKTTLYKELLRRRRRSNGWLTPDEAKVKISQLLYRQNTQSIKDYVKYIILRSGFLKSLHENFMKNINSEKVLFENRHKYKRLFELLCRYVGKEGEKPFLKVKRAVWFMQGIEDIAVIEMGNISNIVIFDESLTQKILAYLVGGKVFDEKFAQKELTGLLLPDAFVYFYSDPRVITSRLNNKDKVSFRDKLLGENKSSIKKFGSYHFREGLEFLSRSGVKGISVDVSNPLSKNIEIIEQFIKKL